MTLPDFYGHVGYGWKMEENELDVLLSAYLINCPRLHETYKFWLIQLVDLKEIETIENIDNYKLYPEAQYELSVSIVDSSKGLPKAYDWNTITCLAPYEVLIHFNTDQDQALEVAAFLAKLAISDELLPKFKCSELWTSQIKIMTGNKCISAHDILKIKKH